MNNQDWKPVVITGKKPVSLSTPKNIVAKTSPNAEKKIKLDEDGQEYRNIYKLNPEEINMYTKMRVAAGLSRVQLAKALNCQSVEIDYLETGKSANSQIGGKYKSYLKTTAKNTNLQISGSNSLKDK